MIRRFLDYLSHNQYRLMIFLLLAGATIFSVLLWRVRSEVSGTVHYAFLIWNLFLAWIPFMIAYFTYTAPLRRKQIYVVLPIAAFVWLIFFPNAPYILTDFQHLSGVWRDVPVWYDVMLLIWFAFTGLLLGMVSLFLMQEIIRREFGNWVGWGFAAVVAGLSSTGIYMGRFLCWNPWDILRIPRVLPSLRLKGCKTQACNPLGSPASLPCSFYSCILRCILLVTFCSRGRPTNLLRAMSC